MVENIMKLHRCADCPIRCQAVAKPHSLFARIHRWHTTWWPGWKIYQRELPRTPGRDTRSRRQSSGPGLSDLGGMVFERCRAAETILPVRGRIDVDTMLPDITRTKQHTAPVTLARGLAWGLIGGLAGTLVMDIVLMGAMLAVGMPALTCFSVVGSTAARFLSIPGFEMAGYVPLGVAAHYLIGPLVGAAFGAVVARVDGLRGGALKKSIVLAVLYVEILSQPLLALTPILFSWTAARDAAVVRRILCDAFHTGVCSWVYWWATDCGPQAQHTARDFSFLWAGRESNAESLRADFESATRC